MMSLDGVFALFGFPDNEENKKLEKEIEDFKNTPHFKIGMYVKLLLNGLAFKKQIVSFFSKADPELDPENMEGAGTFLMYNRAWFWISQCKIKSKVWKEALKDYANEDLVFAINLSISYFEGIEEFEKCAFLKKIKDFLEKSLEE